LKGGPKAGFFGTKKKNPLLEGTCESGTPKTGRGEIRKRGKPGGTRSRINSEKSESQTSGGQADAVKTLGQRRNIVKTGLGGVSYFAGAARVKLQN